jgi:aminoglycoside phosphotransferase (APT) family kinase protein
MTRSKIYKELKEEELNKIVTDLFGAKTKISRYNILKGGLFNTTYFIKTNMDKNGVVLRVSPVNQHLLFEFEKDMMSAEPLFHKLLQEHDIPTSTILKHVSKGEVIEREYILSEYIESIPMNDPSLDGIDLQNIYEEVGALAKSIHRITNDRFGWKRTSGWGEYTKWSDFILAYAKEAADKAEYHGLFDQSDIADFRAIFQNNIEILDEITTPYMTHTDLWQGNVLLRVEPTGYKVAGIIDLDRTIFGDKYWDLSNPWMINEAFLRGYNTNQSYSGNDTVRCDLYRLLGGFFGAYVVLVEYDDGDWFADEKKEAVKLLHKLVAAKN